jgi:hypothetical protein
VHYFSLNHFKDWLTFTNWLFTQLAGIILKQYIHSHWFRGSEKFTEPVVGDTEKSFIRQNILSVLTDSQPKLRITAVRSFSLRVNQLDLSLLDFGVTSLSLSLSLSLSSSLFFLRTGDDYCKYCTLGLASELARSRWVSIAHSRYTNTTSHHQWWAPLSQSIQFDYLMCHSDSNFFVFVSFC